MGKAEQKAKDQKRAQYMKDHNIMRRTARCPICNHIKGLPLDNHINTCRG